MKKITVGFSRSSNKFAWFSWLIMLFQRNNFSHAYIRYHDDEINRDVVFQASGLSVNIIGFDLFKTKEIIVHELDFNISDDSFNKIKQLMLDLSGEPYSILQILNSLIYILFKKNPFDNNIIGWDCSKLIAYLLIKELRYKIPEDLDVITPKDLYNYLENINAK